jgi:hypothetical protein
MLYQLSYARVQAILASGAGTTAPRDPTPQPLFRS